MGAASALDEGTASIKPASRAEWATAAKSEALEPAAYGKPGRRRKMPRQGEPVAKQRRRCKRAREGTQSLHCYESARAKLTGHKPRRCHQRASVNTTRLSEEARTTANAGVGTRCCNRASARRSPNEGSRQLERRSLSRQRALLRPAKTTAGSVTCQQDKPGPETRR